MTLGERIQELRKRDGLSQEQLGERLGVSRQAISKWEGDITVPEVEKLVALSRLFGINVGVLLGVEEPAADGEDVPLNERELAAVEAVAARYVSTTRRWLPIGTALVCVAALVVSFAWNIILSKTLEDYRSQTESNLAALRGQISLLQGQSPTVVAPADDFFSAQACEVDGVDIDAGTVTLRLSVTPKRYVEGMMAQFTVAGQDISAITTPPQTAEGQTFTAVVTVPLDDKVAVTAAIKDGDATETRLLGEFLDLNKESGIILEVVWDQSAADTVAVSTSVGAYSTAMPAESSLRVIKDGKILREEQIILQGENWNESFGNNQPAEAAPAPVTVTFYIPVSGWPEGEIEAYLKDTAGREYTVPLGKK